MAPGGRPGTGRRALSGCTGCWTFPGCSEAGAHLRWALVLHCIVWGHVPSCKLRTTLQTGLLGAGVSKADSGQGGSESSAPRREVGLGFSEADSHSATVAASAPLCASVSWAGAPFFLAQRSALRTGLCVFPVVRRASRGVLRIVIILILSVNIVTAV